MSINLAAVVVRSERRVRLVFTNSLAAGAFTSVGFYTFLNIDGKGVTPGVKAALVIAGAPTNVELVLDNELGNGATYTVTTLAVPAVDTSVSPSETYTFSVGEKQIDVDSEPAQNDVALLLYGRDIVWTGQDYLESPTGDLAVLEGVENAKAAILKRLLSNGLPWDPAYGPKARRFVDGVPQTATALRGALESQALADDRVTAAKATLNLPDDGSGDAFFDTALTLRGINTNLNVQVPVK